MSQDQQQRLIIIVTFKTDRSSLDRFRPHTNITPVLERVKYGLEQRQASAALVHCVLAHLA